MPNWCSNYMRIECDDHTLIDDFLARVIGEGGEFDFRKVIPMPSVYEKLSSGAAIVDGVEVFQWIEDDGVKRVLTSTELLQIEETGSSCRYAWSVANWGTKWNARGTEIDDSEREWHSIEITYKTAWTPPYGVLLTLKDLFPKIDFEFRCRDEDDHPYPHELPDADLVDLLQSIRRIVEC